MGEFEGKVVVITGGAMGIGKGAAVAFAEAGAAVVIADTDVNAGEATAAEIRDQGGEAAFAHADVSEPTDCEAAVQTAVAEFGGLDILFSNAGIQPPDSYLTVEDTPVEMWDRIVSINLKGRFLMAKYAIPEMRKRGGGVIISSASVQGLQSMNMVPAYAATKGGDLSLTRQMALDYAAENIRVVSVCPGAIDTPMLRASVDHDDPNIDQTVSEMGKIHPIGRMGTSEDVARAVLFLASDNASFITGEYLCVDGGLTAQGSWAVKAGALQT